LRLPKNLLSDSYRAPAVYLCQTSKERIGELTVNNFKGTFKWNAYSEISFDIDRNYCDINMGDININPYYDLVEALRLVEVEGFGFFQLQDPEVDSDGIKETKSIKANSSEYDLSQRYLENFIINKGISGSIDGVQLYDQNDATHSLLHLVIAEKAPDWKIGHVDAELATQRRFFEIDRSTVYDFLMNDLCETFKCVIEFDTYDNTINVYAEETAGMDTDVSITFENLSNKINIKYSADDIKTVLTVKGADDLNIREVNYGLPYITDLSYYHTIDWMGQDLYDAYANYLQIVEDNKEVYLKSKNDARVYSKEISDFKNRVDENLTDAKINDFYDFILALYKTNTVDAEKMSVLDANFAYINRYSWSEFKSAMEDVSYTVDQKEIAILKILSIIWDAYGLNTLKIYESSYKERQAAEVAQGMSNLTNENYYQYHATFTMLNSVQNDIAERNTSINTVQKNLDNVNAQISKIAENVSLQNNLTQEQIIRLAPFLREDEYSDDNFIVTETETDDQKLETQEELLKAGYTELRKISEPKLSFTTEVLNVFALDEFAPIVNQFQLGNMIKIELRPDYVKKSRLLEVEISFDNLKDFSVKFGDLLSVRDEADIHADLLSQAINAGKSVANNSSKWQKGSDAANSIQQAINQGLLDATTEIKAMDGTQAISIDKYGIHLRKEENGVIDPEQGWIVSNKFLYTDDAWKTTKSVFGKFTYKDQERWGILADALVGGYVAGSQIEGGEIRIGQIPGTDDYTFVVTSDGKVQINAWGGEIADRVDKIEDSINTYTISIESSNLPVFDENIRNTRLICSIIQNGQKIEAPIGTTYTWIRSSSDELSDELWNKDSSHKNLLNNDLVIESSDVENSARFICEVYIPEDDIS